MAVAVPGSIVVIGASAGGVEALSALASALPADFGAPVVVVLHIPREGPSLLAEILGRRSKLRAKSAEHGERYEAGTIYVAPPDHHVLMSDGTFILSKGPRENGSRPAADPLFRSAALLFGQNAIGVVLSGNLDDGTAGLIAVKRAGGTAIVQNPDEAMYPSMPQSALRDVTVDHCLRIADMPRELVRLVSEAASRSRAAGGEGMDEIEREVRIAEMPRAELASDDRPGRPSPYSCPDCGGVLWEIDHGEFAHYRCRVGHAYSPEGMLHAQANEFEEAVWSAINALEESARLARQLADRNERRGHDWLAKRFANREKEARERAEIIRQVLLHPAEEEAEREKQTK